MQIWWKVVGSNCWVKFKTFRNSSRGPIGPLNLPNFLIVQYLPETWATPQYKLGVKKLWLYSSLYDSWNLKTRIDSWFYQKKKKSQHMFSHLKKKKRSPPAHVSLINIWRHQSHIQLKNHLTTVYDILFGITSHIRSFPIHNYFRCIIVKKC